MKKSGDRLCDHLWNILNLRSRRADRHWNFFENNVVQFSNRLKPNAALVQARKSDENCTYIGKCENRVLVNKEDNKTLHYTLLTAIDFS